jgi:hypothetical protein
MRHSNQGWFRQQVQFLRRQFLQDGDLPFSNVLSEDLVARTVTAIGVFWMDRIYSPLVTLWVFLGQVLSADSCCRAAVARLIAHRLSQGQGACSPETGAYCQARKRLPEKFFSEVARQTGRALEANAESQWLWKRRRVYVYDGSSVSMPDTPKNQSAYPQPVVQKPGLGFPLARIAAVFSLACGAVLDLGICRYAGKGQSELGMLRTLWDNFLPGDVMLADRLMCAWTEMVMLKQRGVDCVCRFTSHRKADFRRGKRLGQDDHIVKWPKPTKPRSIDREAYDALPDFLMIRECRVHVEQPGFRIRNSSLPRRCWMQTSLPRTISRNSIVHAGMPKSATRTTAQALACTSKASPPRISVSALLQVAQWCQQRQSWSQGGDPCPTTSAFVFPPVSSGKSTTDSRGPTLGTVGSQPAAAALPGIERTGDAPSPVRDAEGGDA